MRNKQYHANHRKINTEFRNLQKENYDWIFIERKVVIKFDDDEKDKQMKQKGMQSFEFLQLIHTYFVILSYMIQNKQGEKGKAGCYAVINSKQPQAELPLKYFHYQIEIVQCFANVKMTQVYVNHLYKPLDVQYVYPIHYSCVVTGLEIKFGGNTIQGIVMQRLQAENQFKKNMSEGTEAAYTAFNPQSRDIMMTKIGNIPPKQEIKIILSYSHVNSIVCNMFYQFKLASTMTPRYATNLDQNQINFSHLPYSKNYQSKCTWGLTISIKQQPSKRITKIQSKSHKIKIDQYKNITFANSQLPNRDFSLYYSFQNYQKPSYLLSHSDNTTTAVISFIPKFSQLDLDDAFLQAKEGKTNEVSLDASRGQYIFLLDRSGSMEGVRIQNAKRSLQIFLRSLPENSYFNVLSFGSRYQYLFQKSVKNIKTSLDLAVDKINKMNADMGGTQILDAIKDLVRQPVIEGYPRQLFFLTDGAVSNVSQVLKFISKHTQYTRVNSIGIGNGCSEELIQGCAQKGKGYFTLIKDDEKPQQKIIAMLENTLSPVISKVSLIYRKPQIQSIVPNPEKIPYILKNDIANFYITFKNRLTSPFVFQLKYSNSIGHKYSQTIIINPKNTHQCKWIQSIINFQKIKALSDTYDYDQSIEDRLYYVKKLNKEQLKEQIIKQSIKHQILTDFTAFLCVDILIADSLKEQNLQKKKQSLKIYGMNPADHMVTFSAEKYLNLSSGLYTDQCCIVYYEDPPEQLKNISKFEQTPKVYRPMPLKGKVAGKKQYFEIQGIYQLPNPEKKLAYSYIVKQQETNGSWKEDFLDSIFLDADKMRITFGKIDKLSMITFLVCQYLIRFYSTEAQFSMIIKKGKNYVDKNSKIPWFELQNLFHLNYFDPLSK